MGVEVGEVPVSTSECEGVLVWVAKKDGVTWTVVWG